MQPYLFLDGHPASWSSYELCILLAMSSAQFEEYVSPFEILLSVTMTTLGQMLEHCFAVLESGLNISVIVTSCRNQASKRQMCRNPREIHQAQ